MAVFSRHLPRVLDGPPDATRAKLAPPGLEITALNVTTPVRSPPDVLKIYRLSACEETPPFQSYPFCERESCSLTRVKVASCFNIEVTAANGTATADAAVVMVGYNILSKGSTFIKRRRKFNSSRNREQTEEARKAACAESSPPAEAIELVVDTCRSNNGCNTTITRHHNHHQAPPPSPLLGPTTTTTSSESYLHPSIIIRSNYTSCHRGCHRLQ